MLPMIPMMKRMPTNCTAKEAMSNVMKKGARKRAGSQSWRKLRRKGGVTQYIRRPKAM